MPVIASRTGYTTHGIVMLCVLAIHSCTSRRAATVEYYRLAATV